MTFEDLKRCLILLSYDTVRPEDENQTWHNVLPIRLKTMAHSYAGAQDAQTLKSPHGKQVVLS